MIACVWQDEFQNCSLLLLTKAVDASWSRFFCAVQWVDGSTNTWQESSQHRQAISRLI